MRFQRLDLNLLVALDVLLDEQSVTQAAERLCLSQSATSSALGRLREYFEDDLLVLKGRRMILTPRAEELIEPTRAVLDQIQKTIAIAPEFDPKSTDRRIRIMASDYVTMVLLGPAIQRINTLAPDMRFEIRNMSPSPSASLEKGHVDLLITLDFAVSNEHPNEVLFRDDYVIVADKNNASLKGGNITFEDYLSLGHVTTRLGPTRVPAFDDWYMQRERQNRRIDVIASSFSVVPSLIIGTQRIATMHRRLAQVFAKSHDLLITEVPFDIPHIRELVQWDVSNNGDEGLRWVVSRLKEFANAELADTTQYAKEDRTDLLGYQHEYN